MQRRNQHLQGKYLKCWLIFLEKNRFKISVFIFTVNRKSKDMQRTVEKKSTAVAPAAALAKERVVLDVDLARKQYKYVIVSTSL